MSQSEAVDLRAADECPACGSDDGFVESPAGYYTCSSCITTWAGEIEHATRVDR